MKKLRLWLYLSAGLLTVFWLADWIRRRAQARKLFEATRERRQPATVDDVIGREVEDLEPREQVLARLSVQRRYYDSRRYELVWGMMLDNVEEVRILDAGCGDGYVLQETANVFYGLSPQLFGMDISSYKVSLAHHRLSGRAGLTVGNVERMGFANNTFDVVICTEVLEHLLNVQPGVSELRRILRPGGRVIFSTPSKHAMFLSYVNPLTWLEAVCGLVAPAVLPPFHDLERPEDPQSIVHRAFTRQELQRALRGFRHVSIVSMNMRLPGPVYRVIRSPGQLARIEQFLKRMPVVNQLGETLVVCAVK